MDSLATRFNISEVKHSVVSCLRPRETAYLEVQLHPLQAQYKVLPIDSMSLSCALGVLVLFCWTGRLVSNESVEPEHKIISQHHTHRFCSCQVQI